MNRHSKITELKMAFNYLKEVKFHMNNLVKTWWKKKPLLLETRIPFFNTFFALITKQIIPGNRNETAPELKITLLSEVSVQNNVNKLFDVSKDIHQIRL